MIDRKSIQGFSIVAVIVLITVATLPDGTTVLNVQAQNAEHHNKLGSI
jgi:hypothetical protein